MSKPVFVADFTDIGEPKSPSRASWTLWYILLGLLLPFTVLTYLAVSSASPGDARDRPIALTTLATASGPLTGAIARNGQHCCVSASLRLAAICGPVLALGLFAQVVPLPFRRGEQAVRLTLWSIGWLVCCWADPPRSCTRCPESPRTFPVRSLYCRVGDPFRPVAGGGHGSTLCLLGVL
jgi:hypothetical protein